MAISILSKLRNPHPFIYNRSSVLLPGAITFLLIFIIAPFGFGSLSINYRLLFAIAIGFLSSLSVVLVVTVLRKLVPEKTLEDHWTVGKEVILYIAVLFTICLLIFLFFVTFGLSNVTHSVLFKEVVLITCAISIFPVIIQVLFEQYRFHKRNAQQAYALTNDLKSSRTTANTKAPVKPLQFEAENGKMELQLEADQVVFLKSDGNYVEVYFINSDNKLEKKLVRNRLRVFAQNLPASLFFHCHKSYLINGQHVVSVEGNARNFELVMNFTTSRIPVSRSKSEDISAFLKSLSKAEESH